MVKYMVINMVFKYGKISVCFHLENARFFYPYLIIIIIIMGLFATIIDFKNLFSSNNLERIERI